MRKESPTPAVPTDLRKALATAPKAKAQWESLTLIAQRDFISWIESAKQPETRKRRVESLPSRLASGKRRPCCYAVVPLSLYSALAALPKAKVQWRSLTADEKRDFIDGINAANGSQDRTQCIEKICVALLAGRRHP